MKKILVLGYFGYNTNQLDGQTVKTRNVYQLVSEFYNNVDSYDTEDFKVNKFSIFTMFRKIVACDMLVYLPAHNNLKFIFPIIYCFSVLFNYRIYYFVVGGWLRKFIENLPLHQLLLKRVNGIYVEAQRMKKELMSDLGFSNVGLFPNFRSFDEYSQFYKSKKYEECLKLCFVSRVEKSKGLDTMLAIYEKLLSEGFGDLIKIDVYGPKTDNYFDSYLSNIEMVCYKGVVAPEDVIDVLLQYDALLFPTHYEGEGCPGILVEALSVGLPIIASDWKYNGEFVENGVNGYLCSVYDVDMYCEAIKNLQKNMRIRSSMGLESFRKKDYYSVSNARNLMYRIFYESLN